MALYFYYCEKVEWDRITRLDSPERRYKFHDQIYSVAESFRKECVTLYEYYRDGKTNQDGLYFLRSSPLNRETRYSPGRIIDPNSPPNHCVMLAVLLGYTRLELEIKTSVTENKEHALQPRSGKLKLRWTGKQFDLIELGYGLKEMGSFNDGNASLKEIFEFIGEAFEVETGNTSRLFQDIMTRKTGHTTFIDLMKEKLLQQNRRYARIDQSPKLHCNMLSVPYNGSLRISDCP